MSILVTMLALLVGFPVAYYIAKIARQRSRAALFLLCLIPLWVSDLVRAYGWIVLLRETGVISSALVRVGIIDQPVEMLYNDVTVVIGLVYTVVLFMIVPLVSTLEGMDDALLEAGYNLGGSRFTVFRRIIVPYAMPGIVAGCIITFMLTRGQLPDAGPARRQELQLVHRADLQPVHHPLQLGGRGDLRRPAAALHVARRLGRAEAHRAEPCDDAGEGLGGWRRPDRCSSSIAPTS